MRSRGRPQKYTEDTEPVVPAKPRRVLDEEQKAARREYMRIYMQEYRAFNSEHIREIEKAHWHRKKKFQTGGLENGRNQTSREMETDTSDTGEDP